MLRSAPTLPAILTMSLLLGSAGGCLLISPLDDLPHSSAGASSGASSQGGVPSIDVHGGAAGEAGERAAAGQPGSGGCQSDADCLKDAGEEPYRCRSSNHTCVPAKSEVCPIVEGPFKEPGAIYFGA